MVLAPFGPGVPRADKAHSIAVKNLHYFNSNQFLALILNMLASVMEAIPRSLGAPQGGRRILLKQYKNHTPIIFPSDHLHYEGNPSILPIPTVNNQQP